MLPAWGTFINPVKHGGFNIQQLYVLPTQCVCVLCGSENKQRLCIINSLLFKTESSLILFLRTALLRKCRLNLDLTNSKTGPPVFRQRRSDSVITEVVSWVSVERNRRQDAHTANCRVTCVWTFLWRCIEVAEANTVIFITRYKKQDKWRISCIGHRMSGWLQMATLMVLVHYLIWLLSLVNSLHYIALRGQR